MACRSVGGFEGEVLVVGFSSVGRHCKAVSWRNQRASKPRMYMHMHVPWASPSGHMILKRSASISTGVPTSFSTAWWHLRVVRVCVLDI